MTLSTKQQQNFRLFVVIVTGVLERSTLISIVDSRNAYYSVPSRWGGACWLIGVGLLRVLHSARAGDRLWLPGVRCFVERACFHDMSECFIDNLQ